MSGSKRDSKSMQKIEALGGTIKKLKSGRWKTLRGRPPATEAFKNIGQGAAGLNVPSTGQSGGGSGRTSMKNVFPQFANNPTVLNDPQPHFNPFPKAQTARPSLAGDQRPLRTQMDQTYVAKASINFTNGQKSETIKKSYSIPVDHEAVQTTNKIFDFLWDTHVDDEPKGKSVLEKNNEDIVKF